MPQPYPPQQHYHPPQQHYHPPQQHYHPPQQLHYRPQQLHYQPRYTPPPPKNGPGLAAAIIAPIGILFGLIPLTGFIAVICGLVAVPLALVGWSRYRYRRASNGRTTVFGLIVGIGALALGIWGISIVFGATNQLFDSLSGPAPVIGASANQVDGSTARLGQAVTFDDGTKVLVATPVMFKPSTYAAGHIRDRAIKVDITVTNGTDKPIDAALITVNGRHGGQQATQIFDDQRGLGMQPAGTVLPGKSITFPAAFSIGQNPAEVQIEVRPVIMGEPAIFTCTI
jgi:hypothetical protein